MKFGANSNQGSHDKLNKEKVIKRLSARLGRLGFDVALTPTAA